MGSKRILGRGYCVSAVVYYRIPLCACRALCGWVSLYVLFDPEVPSSRQLVGDHLSQLL